MACGANDLAQIVYVKGRFVQRSVYIFQHYASNTVITVKGGPTITIENAPTTLVTYVQAVSTSYVTSTTNSTALTVMSVAATIAPSVAPSISSSVAASDRKNFSFQLAIRGLVAEPPERRGLPEFGVYHSNHEVDNRSYIREDGGLETDCGNAATFTLSQGQLRLNDAYFSTNLEDSDGFELFLPG